MTKKELVEQLEDIPDDAEVAMDCPGLGYMSIKGGLIVSPELVMLYAE